MAATIDPVPAGRAPSLWRAALGAFGFAFGGLIVIVLLMALLGQLAGQPELSSKVLSLALPTLAAGMLSVLSPCSLPIILGYFSVAFQEQRDRIVLVTLAFLGGVGLTMTILGASFTALGSLVIDEQARISLIGGMLVIAFGVMSFFGKGFTGFKVARRSNLSAGGAFLYGLIFAFGWTACVGPILGSVLTLLLAEGSIASGTLSLFAGGALSLIYVLGLGLPIFLLVLALKGGSNHRDVNRLLRGRGFTLELGSRTIYLHTTAMISGLLLVGLGILLATGQMAVIGQQLAGSRLAQLGVEIERLIPGS